MVSHDLLLGDNFGEVLGREVENPQWVALEIAAIFWNVRVHVLFEGCLDLLRVEGCKVLRNVLPVLDGFQQFFYGHVVLVFLFLVSVQNKASRERDWQVQLIGGQFHIGLGERSLELSDVLLLLFRGLRNGGI